MAADIAALLDELKIERAVLAGLSMGGQIVLEFYRLFSVRVRALVLADTTAQAETEAGKSLRRDTAARLLREGMSLYAEEMLPKMLSARTIEQQPAVAARLLAMMRKAPPVGAAAALRGRAERPDYVELLPCISVPALIVVGSDDTFTPVSDAEFMHERIPSAQLAVVAETGHMPNMEKPDEFNRVLVEFLQTVK
jgi:pimeloyl-ACP methyl ester carboxylesterase